MELITNSLYSEGYCQVYYRFESGALTTDTKGHAALTAISDPADTTGIYGGAVDLDSNDAFSASDNNSYWKQTGAVSWTFRIKGTTKNTLVADAMGLNGGYYGGWYINNDANGYPLLTSWKNTGSGAGHFARVTGTVNVCDDKWHFVAITQDGTNLKIYIDGVWSATTAWAYYNAYGTNTSCRLGCYWCAGESSANTEFLTNKLDDFAIFSKALSETEQYQLFIESKTATAKSRLQQPRTNTVTAKGRIKVSKTQTVTAKACVPGSVSRTTTSKARIKISLTKTVTSKANIRATKTRTITTKASIFKVITRTITSKANIRVTTTRTVTAKANMCILTTRTVTAKAKIDIFSTTTRTAFARANIYPSQSFIDEVNKVARVIDVEVKMQWDGITWTDETDYFISAQGNEQMSDESGEGVAATLDIEVDNTTGRFTPGNTLSPIYAYLKPRVPIRISIIMGGYTYRLFTGYIKNIHPNTKTGVCSFECYDNQVIVSNKRANGIVYEDKRSEELLVILYKLALGMKDTDYLDPSLYSFDTGVHVVNFGYFEDRNVWPIMGEIASAERGRVFFDRDGILKFWNRERLHNRSYVIALTQDDWVTELDYSVAEHQVKNAVTVQAKPRANAGVQVIWNNGNVAYLDPYSDTLVMVPGNGSQNAWLDLEDPCTLFITPIANTDYTANSLQDGTGTDLTDNISVTNFTNYGNAVFLTVVNNGATDAYLTKFQIRGNPARILNYISVTATDDPSIANYGRQDLEIQNDFVQDEYAATAIAYEELWRRQDAINLFKIGIIGIPYIVCGDTLSVEYLPGVFKNYMIDTIDWTLDDGGFMQKLTMVNPYLFPSIARVDAKARIGTFSTQTVTAKAHI